jgi:hypothetical protein
MKYYALIRSSGTVGGIDNESEANESTDSFIVYPFASTFKLITPEQFKGLKNLEDLQNAKHRNMMTLVGHGNTQFLIPFEELNNIDIPVELITNLQHGNVLLRAVNDTSEEYKPLYDTSPGDDTESMKSFDTTAATIGSDVPQIIIDGSVAPYRPPSISSATRIHPNDMRLRQMKFMLPTNNVDYNISKLSDFIKAPMGASQQHSVMDVSNSMDAAKLLTLSNKLISNALNGPGQQFIDPDIPKYSIFHKATDRTKLLAEVINDLDVVQEYGLTIKESSNLGYTMNVPKLLKNDRQRLQYALYVLSGIHKRGIIMHTTKLYYNRVNVFACSYYAAVDTYEHLLHIADKDGRAAKYVEKYTDDTLRLFKLCTTLDVINYCNLYQPEFSIWDDFVKYIEGNFDEWFIDIILDKFLKTYTRIYV